MHLHYNQNFNNQKFATVNLNFYLLIYQVASFLRRLFIYLSFQALWLLPRRYKGTFNCIFRKQLKSRTQQ